MSVVEEYEVDAPPPKAEPKAEDNATAENATETNATEATEAAKDDDKPAEAAAEPRRRPRRRGDGRGRARGEASDATGAAPGKVLKKKTHKRTLTVTPSTAGLRQWQPRPDAADVLLDRLAAIAAAEKERRAREGAKNDLEAAIYRVRNALDASRPEIGPRRRRSSARRSRRRRASSRMALRGRRRACGDLQRQARGL